MFYYADTADKNAILENFKVRLYPTEKLNRVTDNLYRWITFDKYDKIDVDSSIIFCDTQDDLLNTLQDNFINWVTNQALPQDKAEFIITFNAFDITDEAVAVLNKSIANENINCKFYKTLGLIK
jgi:hypothetical protein